MRGAPVIYWLAAGFQVALLVYVLLRGGGSLELAIISGSVVACGGMAVYATMEMTR